MVITDWVGIIISSSRVTHSTPSVFRSIDAALESFSCLLYSMVSFPNCFSKSLPIINGMAGSLMTRAVPFISLFWSLILTLSPRCDGTCIPSAKATVFPSHLQSNEGNRLANSSDTAVMAAPVSINASVWTSLQTTVVVTKSSPAAYNALSALSRVLFQRVIVARQNCERCPDRFYLVQNGLPFEVRTVFSF